MAFNQFWTKGCGTSCTYVSTLKSKIYSFRISAIPPNDLRVHQMLISFEKERDANSKFLEVLYDRVIQEHGAENAGKKCFNSTI